MGSISELRLGPICFGHVKNGVDPQLMTMFRESDLSTRMTDKDGLKLIRATGGEFLEDNELITVVEYACPAWVARDRLDLMGFTRQVAEKAFRLGIKEQIQRQRRMIVICGNGLAKDYFEEKLSVVSDLTIESWLDV